MALFGKKESQDIPAPPGPTDLNSPSMGAQPTNNYYGQPAAPAPPTDPYANLQQPEPTFSESSPDTERFEEIAEAIINEKWNELIRDINKVIEWKERTDTQIKRIEQEIVNLKERFESLHRGVLGKISSYDQNLTNVGTEIKSMQMAFKKILPTFTENVNKLERLARSKD